MPPSREAFERMDRVHVALLAGEASVREIRGRLSEPMSRADLDSAIRRLAGAELVTHTVGSHPRRWVLTRKGERIGALKVRKFGVKC
jgi:hypothetical protein